MMGLAAFNGLGWIYIYQAICIQMVAQVAVTAIAKVQNLRCNKIRSCKYYGAAVVCFIYRNSSTLACERESNLLHLLCRTVT